MSEPGWGEGEVGQDVNEVSKGATKLSVVFEFKRWIELDGSGSDDEQQRKIFYLIYWGAQGYKQHELAKNDKYKRH